MYVTVKLHLRKKYCDKKKNPTENSLGFKNSLATK